MNHRFLRPLAVVTATAAIASVGLTTASAEPGHPGTPGAPAVVFHEDFEAAPHTGYRTMLNDYAGGAYTADPYWLSAPMANGLVLSWTNTRRANDGTGANNGTEATAFATLKQLSEAIGKVNGTPRPQDNMAISAYTQSEGTPPAGNKVMFKTATESLKVADSKGRFLAFSLSAAAANCANANYPNRQDPQYKLYVVQNGVETPLSADAINPCTDSRAKTVAVSDLANSTLKSVRAGVFTSDRSFLYDGETFGFVLRNGTSAHLGNDGAFDDITVLDVTPQLDKAFGTETATVGESVRLTLTVTNTSELAQKDGWSFTDTLPAGMVVADNPNVVVDGNATVTATPGSGEIVVTDGSLEANDNAMTISVDVVVHEAGSYTNSATNITARRGVDAPGSSTVTFVTPESPIVTGDLVVRYVDEDGKDVANGYTDEGTVGDGYATEAKTVDGYELIATPTNASGSYVEGTTEVVYVYRKVQEPTPATGELVVRYIDEDGKDVANGYTDEGTVGDDYATKAKTVDGYELIATPTNASGSYVEGTTLVTYVYRTVQEPQPGPAQLVVRYVDEDGKEVASGYSHEGTVGDDYATEAKTVDGYELIAAPTNASGSYAEGTTEVVYVYRKVQEPTPATGDLVVRYIDEDGKDVANGYTDEGTVGDDYATEAKTVDGYELVAVPVNQNGTYAEGTTEVIYVYKKLSPATLPADLTVRFVDEKGKQLAATEERAGIKGEEYSTHAATIRGYELIAVPENASGTMEPGTEVVYVYRKIADTKPAPTPEPTAPAKRVNHEGADLPKSLSHTGSEATGLAAIAGALALGGLALVGAGRRREP